MDLLTSSALWGRLVPIVTPLPTVLSVHEFQLSVFKGFGPCSQVVFPSHRPQLISRYWRLRKKLPAFPRGGASIQSGHRDLARALHFAAVWHSLITAELQSSLFSTLVPARSDSASSSHTLEFLTLLGSSVCAACSCLLFMYPSELSVTSSRAGVLLPHPCPGSAITVFLPLPFVGCSL